MIGVPFTVDVRFFLIGSGKILSVRVEVLVKLLFLFCMFDGGLRGAMSLVSALLGKAFNDRQNECTEACYRGAM